MISAICFTNIDEFNKVEWPQGFAAMPRIGDNVQGYHGKLKPVLKVVGITHGWNRMAGQPHITVELHR